MHNFMNRLPVLVNSYEISGYIRISYILIRWRTGILEWWNDGVLE